MNTKEYKGFKQYLLNLNDIDNNPKGHAKAMKIIKSCKTCGDLKKQWKRIESEYETFNIGISEFIEYFELIYF